MSKVDEIYKITQGEDILSALDVFDLDESVIDEKIKEIMEKANIKSKHLKTMLVFVKYKYIITLQEETDCDNKNIVDFSIHRLLKAACADEDFKTLLDIFSISLALSTENILNYVEHILQQLLTAIDFTPSSLDQDSKQIIVYLKVLDCLLDVCTKQKIVIDSRFINEEIDKLLSKQDSSINTQLISKTIPKIVQCCEDFDILNVVWNRIVKKLDILTVDDFVILCSMSDFYFPKKDDKLYTIMDCGIIKNKEFWILLKNGFLSEDYSTRKCSIYLAKRAIVFASEKESSLSISGDNDDHCLFHWEIQNKVEIESSWMNLFILLETLEEKQSHLVLSGMHLLGRIKAIHDTWYNCALVRAFSHETDAVITKAIEMALENNNSNHTLKSFPFRELLKALNNTFLYDNAFDEEKNKILKSLKTFLSHERNLFAIMECMESFNLAPIPKFYMSFALTSISKTTVNKLFLNNIVQAFLGDCVSTPNNIQLRFATQSCMFYFVKEHKPPIPNMIDFNLLFSVTDESLHRGNKQWNDISHWINHFKSNEQIRNNVKSMMSISYLKTLSDIRSIVKMFILCADTEIIQNYEFLEFIIVLIQLLKESESREYASCDEFDLIFYFIINTLKEISYPKQHDNGEADNKESNKIFCNITEIILKNALVIFNYIIKRLRSVSELKDYESINKYIEGLTILLILKNDSHYLYKEIQSLIFPMATSCLSEGNAAQKYFSVQIIALITSYTINNSFDKLQQKTVATTCFNLINDKPTSEFLPYSIDYELKSLRGRMMSICNRARCEIYLSFYKILCNDNYEFTTHIDQLHTKVINLLESGGIGCLSSIISLSHILLPFLVQNGSYNKASEIIARIWKEILEIRKNDQFKLCIKQFIAMLFQHKFIEIKEMETILIDYGDKIFVLGELSPFIIYELIKHFLFVLKDTKLQSIVSLISKGLVFGSVLRKDQRIEYETCNFILSHEMFSTDDIKFIPNPTNSIRILALDILKNQDEDFHDILFSELKLRLESISGSKPRYHGNSLQHRLLLRVLQVLLFSHKVHPNAKIMEENVQWCIQHLIKQPHHVSTRIMLEWNIALFLIKNNSLLNKHVMDNLKLSQIPELSYFMIMYHVVKHQILASKDILHLRDKKNNSYYENLRTSTLELDNYIVCQNFHFVIETLLPYTMGQLFNLRLHAQYLTMKLYRLAEHTRYREKYNIICDTIAKAFVFSAKEKNLIKIQEDFYVNVFDVVFDLTVDNIYGHVPRLTGVAKDELIITGEAAPKMGNLHNIQAQGHIVETNEKCEILQESTNINIQKKFVPWNNMLADLNINVERSSDETCYTSGLIVVASLIDRLPNLGGLSRTCEVFGVKKYVIDSLRHIQDKQFQSLSVSSERWVDIAEVRPGNDLKNYLLEIKSKGYSIVGAEQTSSSIRLNNFDFPKNTVLLLGHEKEGIPCDLLNLMDYCVEIPQYGMVRSLNVHVTASIFIWEYIRQHPIAVSST